MKGLSLFSGIGGLDLAAEWAGITPVAFCEKDTFCQKVLAKHWPGIPIYDDVTTLPYDTIPPVDIIYGGYPCQPFSIAGKRGGHTDTRHLWPAMRSIISGVHPTWVVGENVKGHVTLGLDEVIDDLEGLGYACQAFCIPAFSVGACHTRERVFVVAHTAGHGRDARQITHRDGTPDERASQGSHQDFLTEGCSRLRVDVDRHSQTAWGGGTEPGVRRVPDGIPNRVDRLRSLGNAVVPQQAYPLFRLVANLHRLVTI